MLPKAAPMITPMARSTTFPRKANFLNSSNIFSVPPSKDVARKDERNSVCRDRTVCLLIGQTGMDHRPADGGFGRFGKRDHGQPYRLSALAEQRKRVLRRRRICFEEQGCMQRHQLVLIF